jgi:hypothetical protein
MSDEMKNNNLPAVDGFDDCAGDDQQIARVILGEKWQFTNDGTWVNGDDAVIPPDREVVVVDTARVLQKWIDQTPVRDATRFLPPGEQVDVEQLNEDCPRSEWSDDLNGKPRGPWQLQNVVYMVDLETMQRFTFPTGTVGGSICVGDLKDAVRMMRRFRGPGVYPAVSASSKVMKTRFGKRQRPHFEIKRWVSFGPEGTPALPTTSPPSLPPASSPSPSKGPDRKAATAPGQNVKTQNSKVLTSGAHIVEEPTLREELNDEIPTNW